MIPPRSLLLSRLIVGGSGSGKSIGTINELVQLAIEGHCSIVLMDSHGLTARLFFIHLIDLGLTHRVLYDRFSSFLRVLPGISVTQSNDPDPKKRRSINRARVIALVNILWRATQREEDVWTLPVLSKYLKWSIQLILFQPVATPLSRLPFAFYPNHSEFHRLVKACTDIPTKLEGEYLATLHKSRNFTLLDGKITPAQRVVETSFDFEAFKERLGDLDIDTIIKSKQIIILDGSDDGSVPKPLATAIFGCWNLRIFSYLQQHFAQTNEPLPVVIVWEEAPATRIIGSYEVDMLREGRKTGLSCWVVGQDLAWLEPKIKAAVKSCTPEHVWYNAGDEQMAMQDAAPDVAVRQLDSHKIHHVDETERILTDGFDYETRETVSESEHHKGKTISRVEVPVPRQRMVTDKKISYEALNDQIQLTATDNLQMHPGWRQITNRYIRYASKAPEYIEMLPDPFPESDFPGLADDKFNEGLAESQSRAEFICNGESEEKWEETTTPMEKSGQNKPSKSLPKPRTPRDS